MATKNNVMDAIFANLNKAGISLTIENSHRSVFKKEIITQLTDDEAKSFRKKVRKTMLTFAQTLIAMPRDEKALRQFNTLYKEVYAVNDYSLTSICAENMKQVNKDILTKALAIAKKSLGNEK